MNKLIKLSPTHYIVVDDSEIKEKDWFYFKIDNIVDIVQVESKFHLEKIKKHKENKKVTHSTQPELLGIGWMQSVKPLLLSEVEELINGYSVEKMAKLHCPDEISFENMYIRGFKAHEELVKDKVFTIEETIEFAMNMIAQYVQGNTNIWNRELLKQSIQSLLPTEWDITIDENNKITLL